MQTENKQRNLEKHPDMFNRSKIKCIAFTKENKERACLIHRN